MPNDPCLQTGTPCEAAMGRGIAMCGPDKQWGMCVCVTPTPASPNGVAANGVVMTPACGNGVIEMDKGETCERSVPMPTVTCAAMLGTGATGLVQCDLNCHIDATMCQPPAMAASKAPMGGATGGGGSGM